VVFRVSKALDRTAMLVTDDLVVLNGSMTTLLVVPLPEMESTPAAKMIMVREYQKFVSPKDR